MVNPAPDATRRARARLLLALCTFALGIGLGIVIALPATRGGHREAVVITAPGDVETRLEPGRHTFAIRPSADSLPFDESRPVCTTVRLGANDSQTPVPVVEATDAGFAAMRITQSGEYRVACSAAVDGLDIVVTREASTDSGPYLRAAVTTLGLTALAVLLAARPLLYLRARRA
jgi:hypothetical protein